MTFKPDTGGLDRAGLVNYSRAPSPDSVEPASGNATINAFELPPISAVARHIEHFFRHTGILFPFVHEPTFMNTFALFKATGKVRRSWLGLLNIMMAMGCSWLWEGAEGTSSW